MVVAKSGKVLKKPKRQKKTKKAKNQRGKKWQKIKVRVKSSINPFMTQFVGIGGKKVAKKCHHRSALSQQGLRDVGGKKQWCFFIFQLLRYKKKYVRFYSKIVIFFCHFATFYFFMYYKTLYINLFSTLRFSFYSPLFLPLFFFFCHQPLINPFVATVYTFLYFLPLFLPLFFFFATFEPKRKKRRRRGKW